MFSYHRWIQQFAHRDEQYCEELQYRQLVIHKRDHLQCLKDTVAKKYQQNQV